MIKIKDGEVRPEGCICELNFGYNAKTIYALEFGYTEVRRQTKGIAE